MCATYLIYKKHSNENLQEVIMQSSEGASERIHTSKPPKILTGNSRQLLCYASLLLGFVIQEPETAQ